MNVSIDRQASLDRRVCRYSRIRPSDGHQAGSPVDGAGLLLDRRARGVDVPHHPVVLVGAGRVDREALGRGVVQDVPVAEPGELARGVLHVGAAGVDGSVLGVRDDELPGAGAPDVRPSHEERIRHVPVATGATRPAVGRGRSQARVRAGCPLDRRSLCGRRRAHGERDCRGGSEDEQGSSKVSHMRSNLSVEKNTRSVDRINTLYIKIINMSMIIIYYTDMKNGLHYE